MVVVVVVVVGRKVCVWGGAGGGGVEVRLVGGGRAGAAEWAGGARTAEGEAHLSRRVGAGAWGTRCHPHFHSFGPSSHLPHPLQAPR